MKHLVICLLLVCCCGAANAQLASNPLQLNYSGCYSLDVTYTDPGGFPIRGDLFLAGDCVCCTKGVTGCGGECVDKRTLAMAPVAGAVYYLEKLINGSFTVVARRITNASRVNFSGSFFNAGVYRVRIIVETTTGVPVFNYLNPCSSAVGFWTFGGAGSFISSTIEIGDPVPMATILDRSGTWSNNVFCEGDILAVGPWLNGAASTNETSWRVDICQTTSQGCSNWNTTDWKSGQVDLVDLLNDVWKINHPDWRFWPGTYRVTLAVANPCSYYEAVNVNFQVVSSGCRLGRPDVEQVRVVPNPASEEIRFEGLATGFDEPAEVSIFDREGRLLKRIETSSLMAPVSLDGLSDGFYIARIKQGSRMLSSKFLVSRQ